MSLDTELMLSVERPLVIRSGFPLPGVPGPSPLPGVPGLEPTGGTGGGGPTGLLTGTLQWPHSSTNENMLSFPRKVFKKSTAGKKMTSISPVFEPRAAMSERILAQVFPLMKKMELHDLKCEFK